MEYIKKMSNLREEVLIRKGFLYFLLPAIIEGILGCFVPIVYIFIPVHEADFCLCSFFEIPRINEGRALLNSNTFETFKAINTMVFLGLNWIFLVLLLLKIYRIRHINDETLIKRECAAIVGAWTSFSLI